MTTNMVTVAKSFIKNNFMELVLAGMFTAFWMQYNEDQKEAAKFREDTHQKVDRLESRQLTVASIIYNDKDTNPYFKDIVYEWIKQQTRGN